MSSTEGDFEKLAGSFFDQVIEPLAWAKRTSFETGYFPLGPDADAQTYFEEPTPLRRMTPADFEFAGSGSAAGLIAELSRYWAREGETALAATSPRLLQIADALKRRNSKPNGDVDIFCYTLF